jgi:hypothetical protein
MSLNRCECLKSSTNADAGALHHGRRGAEPVNPDEHCRGDPTAIVALRRRSFVIPVTRLALPHRRLGVASHVTRRLRGVTTRVGHAP